MHVYMYVWTTCERGGFFVYSLWGTVPVVLRLSSLFSWVQTGDPGNLVALLSANAWDPKRPVGPILIQGQKVSSSLKKKKKPILTFLSFCSTQGLCVLVEWCPPTQGSTDHFKEPRESNAAFLPGKALTDTPRKSTYPMSGYEQVKFT